MARPHLTLDTTGWESGEQPGGVDSARPRLGLVRAPHLRLEQPAQLLGPEDGADEQDPGWQADRAGQSYEAHS